MCLAPRHPEGHEAHPEKDPRTKKADNEPIEDPCVRLDLVDPGLLVSLLPFYMECLFFADRKGEHGCEQFLGSYRAWLSASSCVPVELQWYRVWVDIRASRYGKRLSCDTDWLLGEKDSLLVAGWQDQHVGYVLSKMDLNPSRSQSANRFCFVFTSCREKGLRRPLCGYYRVGRTL